ncbi:MAG: DUF559 domain-containing protein, partial [Candidatus Methylomirabilis sp.]|nr:DUF559 domain-containing protein [Deltaproteobacteria bacterium]
AGISLKAEALDPHAVRALQEGKRRREAQLEEVVRYAHARRCRMSFLLEYFGDADADPCGVCDNCLGAGAAAREGAGGPYDPQRADRAIAGNLLLAVRRLEGRYGKSLVVKVLRGSRAKVIEERGLDRLSLYGALKRFPQARVAGALDGLELRGLVAVEPGLYPTVRITPAGRDMVERMRGEREGGENPSPASARSGREIPSPGAQRRGEGKGEGARGEPQPHGAHSDRERGSKAREQRREMTEAENRLWFHLRGHRLEGLKFRRQHPIGPWIVDFVCLSKRLIVEVDGGQHAERSGIDAERTESLERSGFTVLRFWNDEVLTRTDAVLDRILTTVAETSE